MNERHEPWSEKWRRFRNRPAEDRRLILCAAMIMPLTELGLRVFGFQRWKELIERFAPAGQRTPSLPVEVQRERAIRTERAVRSVQLHGLTTPNCLERSMTLWWMLRGEGVPGELHIGARKMGGRLEAHAWVELHGQILNDSPEVRGHYARFDAPIAAAINGPGTERKTNAHSPGEVNFR